MFYNTDSKSGGSFFRALLLALLVLCVAPGCADYAGGALDIASSRPAAYNDDLISLAEDSLTRHDIEGAQTYYGAALENNDPFVEGTAAAGKGMMDLFLLAGQDSARTFLSQQLGATNRRYDIQRLVWSNNGVLYWFSQGVRWDDDGDFQGVRSIVSDQLPWQVERLDSLAAFASGLTQPGDAIMSSLLGVAEDIRQIERDLEVAIDDPKFEFLYLPADVFHADSLAMALGKSELSVIHAGLSFFRGSIYFAAAYQNSWTLDGLLVSPDNRDPEAHFHDTLDPLLAREITQQNNLREARSAFLDGFFYLENSITLGLEQEQTLKTALLRWDKVDRDLARNLRDIIRAMANSLDGPAKIPHFTQDFTIDLSVFFGEGRALPEDVSWFQMESSTTGVDGAAGTSTWSVTDDAIQTYFLDGVFDPPMRVGRTYEAQPDIDNDRLETFFENLLGDAVERTEAAYAGSGLIE
jgi:hypothetical protein